MCDRAVCVETLRKDICSSDLWVWKFKLRLNSNPPGKWMPPTRHSQLNRGMDTVWTWVMVLVLGDGKSVGAREREKVES